MKTITNDYLTQVTQLGREYDAYITYTIDNEDITLTSEELNKVNPHYEGNILKSVMKQLDLDSNVDIPLETEINCRFGLKVDNSYEYIDLGNYIVYSSEKQEDLNSYKIICYDKMLYAMIDYEDLNISYPISTKNYLTAICNHLNLTLATSEFVNDDTLITSERYLTSDGEKLGYTFRDVLDEIAQVTASTICINNNDEVEVRYITDAQAPTIQTQTRSTRSLRSENEESLVPDGYTQVEYIKTPSNSFGPYIKITPSIGTKATLEFDFKVGTNGTGYLYGFNSSNNYDYKHTYSYISNDLYVISVNRYENDYWTIEKNKKYKMKITRTGNTSTTYEMTDEDSTTIHSGSAGQGYSIREVSFPIFATEYYVNNVLDNTEYSKDIYLYRFKVYSGWGGTTLDNDLVPCTRDSDNKPGLYDIVNDVFYVNVGTGEFEIPSPGPTPTDTITIDEEYLNDTNVNFKEKYGPVNTLVLGRSLDLDNIYRQDTESVAENGVTEIRISDNQILNTDDRENFIDEMFEALDGLEYQINDYDSKGITFLDLCDRYNVQVGEETYSCVMLNDDLDITQGFEEKVHTDLPDEARTDYEKASKSDRTQRRTELIVDKQNQQIDAIIGVDKEHFSSLTELKLDVDGVDSKVESNYSFERTASSQSSITINEIQQNGLLELVISGIIDDVVVVSNSTLVGDNTIIKDTTLVVEDGNGNKKYYELSIPNLAQGDKYYWQLLFDDITKTYTPKAKVVRDGGTTINIPNAPYIEFEAGEETFYLEDYNDLVYQVKYAILNDMVGVFATQVQMNTEIKQSAEEVVIEANKYTDGVGEDLQAQINVTAQGVESKVSKGEVISSINQSAEAIKIQAGKIELEGYVTTNGDFQVTNGRLIASNGQFEGTITIRTSDAINVVGNDNLLDVKITNTGVRFYDNNGSYSGMATSVNTGTNRGVGLGDYNGSHFSIYSGMAYFDGSNGVHAYGFHQISLASEKKNIKLYKDNAIKKIKETDIYSFIYKNDETNRERIGFVIGDNHNTAKEIIDNNSIDLYSVVGILWKAIQEQQEEIEKLKEMIK